MSTALVLDIIVDVVICCVYLMLYLWHCIMILWHFSFVWHLRLFYLLYFVSLHFERNAHAQLITSKLKVRCFHLYQFFFMSSMFEACNITTMKFLNFFKFKRYNFFYITFTKYFNPWKYNQKIKKPIIFVGIYFSEIYLSVFSVFNSNSYNDDITYSCLFIIWILERVIIY